MLSLSDHVTTFRHFSNYSEKRGKKDEVHGVALQFSTTVAADVLDLIEQGFAAVLFSNDAPRFPYMDPIASKRELIGASITLRDEDLFGKRRLTFGSARVDRFVIKPNEGRSAALGFRVLVKPEPDDVAMLFQLQHRDIRVTLDPAKASERTTPDLVDKAEGEGGEGSEGGEGNAE